MDLGLGPQHFVQARHDVDLDTDLVAAPHEVDSAAVAGARERQNHSMDAVELDEALELVGLAEVRGVADVVGQRVVVDESDDADSVLRPGGELLDHAACDAARSDHERGLGRHQPAADDHAGDGAHRGGEHHERDEEDGELVDRRLLDAERGVGELTRPRRRRGQQHDSRDIVGRAVRHAQLVLRVVAVEPGERDPREQPAEDQRRMGERLRSVVERADAHRGDQERKCIGSDEAAPQEPSPAAPLGVSQARRRVIVEARVVIRDCVLCDQGGDVRTCLKRRCRHTFPCLPVQIDRGWYSAESCTNLR